MIIRSAVRYDVGNNRCRSSDSVFIHTVDDYSD